MKLDLGWLSDYVDWQRAVDSDGLVDLIARRLGEVESIVDLADKYRLAEIVRVEAVEPCPGRDRIRLAKLKTASGVQTVVCGAPNLKPGALAVWLPPGGVIPASWGSSKPVVLTPKEIAGVVSQGMLLSAAELDWAPDDDGIVLFDDSSRAPFWAENKSTKKPQVGQSLVEHFGLDLVIEIENKMFTHRPDCFGLLGLAREVAGITGQPFQSPDWYHLTESKGALTKPEIIIDCPDFVSRFWLSHLRGLTVKPSSLSVLVRLSGVGIKPVNNLVDVTNYMMYLTGQPTHVFDWKALGQPSKIGVRRSRSSDELQLLNGQTLNFVDDKPATLVVADDQPVSLGGVMGGQATVVANQTQDVVLEAANFDMYDIWRTTMNYGLFTPAATRFSKGQSPHQVGLVGHKITELLALVGGGEVVGYADKSSVGVIPQPIKLSVDFVNRRLGTEMTTDQIGSILSGVGLATSAFGDGQLEVSVPFWRTDLQIAEDIVEEVGRLAGYENITPILPVRSIIPPPVNSRLEFRRNLRRILAGAGANEVVGYSFVGSDLLLAANQRLEESFEIKKPLRPQLQFYRQSLTPTLVSLINQSSKAPSSSRALFEIGCCHWLTGPVDDEGLPLDQPRLSLVYLAAKDQPDRPFYSVRRYLDLLASSLGVNFAYRPAGADDLPANWLAPYQLSQSATVWLAGEVIGVVGGLGEGLAGFEIDPQILDRIVSANRSLYQPLSRYPSSCQDLTLRVSSSVLYADLLVCFEPVLAQSDCRCRLELLSIWSPPKEGDYKHISWRLEMTSDGQTLKTATVSAMVDRLASAAQKLGASLVV